MQSFAMIKIVIIMLFSADRTISHANMLECCVCLSVCRLWCMYCG